VITANARLITEAMDCKNELWLKLLSHDFNRGMIKNDSTTAIDHGFFYIGEKTHQAI